MIRPENGDEEAQPKTEPEKPKKKMKKSRAQQRKDAKLHKKLADMDLSQPDSPKLNEREQKTTVLHDELDSEIFCVIKVCYTRQPAIDT